MLCRPDRDDLFVRGLGTRPLGVVQFLLRVARGSLVCRRALPQSRELNLDLVQARGRALPLLRRGVGGRAFGLVRLALSSRLFARPELPHGDVREPAALLRVLHGGSDGQWQRLGCGWPFWRLGRSQMV